MSTSVRIETDLEVLASFLSDAAHVPGGFAAGIAFPTSTPDVCDIVRSSTSVLAIGAQSSLTGGATPRGETLLSTRALTEIDVDVGRARVRVGAGVPLNTLQSRLAAHGLWYPPAPTFDGAFVGGTLSTNAAGAATFKYGSARPWVEELTVVLADGRVLSLKRGVTMAAAAALDIPVAEGAPIHVPVPRYVMPDVPKLSAGYYARPGMDLVDLFVGSEGTLGVITEAVLRVTNRRRRLTALVECVSDKQALDVSLALRAEGQRAWRGDGALDVAAIEFMDARSLARVEGPVFARAGVNRPATDTVLLVQLEIGDEAVEPAVDALAQLLARAGVTADPVVALPGDETAASGLFALREAVPAGVNAAIGAAKAREPSLEKTAGDMIVPIDRLRESLALYRRAFETRGLDYAIWGHVSDGNLHPNVIPRTREEMVRGREALREIAREVIAMGGAPLAEHGVGRSSLKQEMLRALYGDSGIDAMRAVKRALDPSDKLAPGVLFPPAASS